MTEEEIEQTMSEAKLSTNERTVAERLLRGERLFGRQAGVSHTGLNGAVRRLRGAGVPIARMPQWSDAQLALKASGGQPGRPAVHYWLLEPGETAPLAPKPKAKTRPGARKRAEVVPAAPTPSVYPKGMKHLPPLPDFGGGLMTTGLVLTDSGAVEVHLRNGEGTFIAELTGYRAKEHA